VSGEDVVRHKLAQRAQRFAELSELLADPEVAGQPRKFQEYLREHGRLEASAQLQRTAEELGRRRAQAEELLADGSVDRELRELAREELAQLTPAEAELSQAIVAELVRDEDLERRKLIVELRAGTGGDEATLFVRDLYEMYGRYIDSRGWRREAIDAASSDVGGFKEVVFAVEGEGAWNCLRFESGGHRVQRVPATESQGRIHTSLATVAVLPEAEAVELELRDEDLRIDTMRAGGPGGQSVNTTSSAVRITHLPTGTVVQCQDEKSQLKNKAKALRVLRARLFDAEQRRRDEERAEARRGLVGSGDRSQRIRTYNFPQARVSDHRLEGNHSLEPILAGRLQPLLDQLLALDRAERIRQL
jgi:peptide chain release factor 1